jgi:hypothetical protein
MAKKTALSDALAMAAHGAESAKLPTKAAAESQTGARDRNAVKPGGTGERDRLLRAGGQAVAPARTGQTPRAHRAGPPRRGAERPVRRVQRAADGDASKVNKLLSELVNL